MSIAASGARASIRAWSRKKSSKVILRPPARSSMPRGRIIGKIIFRKRSAYRRSYASPWRQSGASCWLVEKERSMKLFSYRLVALLALMLLCLQNQALAQVRKIKVCTPGAGTGSMHIYAAKDRGYFAQEELDVDVLVTRGQICTMALINGQMEVTSNPNVFD